MQIRAKYRLYASICSDTALQSPAPGAATFNNWYNIGELEQRLFLIGITVVLFSKG
jgi:hypothetical protein